MLPYLCRWVACLSSRILSGIFCFDLWDEEFSVPYLHLVYCPQLYHHYYNISAVVLSILLLLLHMSVHLYNLKRFTQVCKHLKKVVVINNNNDVDIRLSVNNACLYSRVLLAVIQWITLLITRISDIISK